MGFSAGYYNPQQIAKEITQADLSHITSEYTNKDVFYCGGENVHLNLAGEELGIMNNHNPHTAGTLWAYSHTHAFSYIKDGDVITAYCRTSPCPSGTSATNSVTLKISAESKGYSATETYAGAKILDADGVEIRSDNVNKWTSVGFSIPSIEIYKVTTEGATSGGVKVSDLTGLDVGNYYACVKLSTTTLSKAFKITMHTHNWNYTADGATLKAYCDETEGAEYCEYQGADKAISLTLSARSVNYSGSPYAGLSFEGKDDWNATVGSAKVIYIGRGNTTYEPSTIAPNKLGTYTVKVYPASEDADPVHVITKDFEITRVTPAPGVDKIIDIDDINWTYKFYKNGRYKRTGDDEKGTITNVKFYNISGTTIAINLGYGISGSFGNISNAEYSELLSIDKIKEFIGDTSNYVGVQVNYYESSHNLQFSIILHDHNWNYSADGNKIEAYCANDDCLSGTSETDKIALTLNAESQTVSQKEAYTGASLENLEAFMGATELDEEPIIKYYKVDAKGATTGGSEVEAAKVRATVGNYYASVTVGDVTAVKAFEIKNDTATSYDTIVTKEFDTGKSKKGITIGKAGDESSANLNGIITINAKIKVTMLDKEWTPTGYVLSRVTPDNLAATKWVSVSDNKVEQKNLKKLAAVKYNKKKNQTLINLKQNKKIEGGVYAIRLEDGKGNTICINIECIELAKDIKKSALKINTVETVPSAEEMLATKDGDTAKTIALTMLGSSKQSEFNSNAVTWVIGSGKNASTLKKGEEKAVADKSGKAIAYLTVADNGTVKVVSGTVKGKVKLTGVVNRKAYKTTVTVK